VEEENHGDAASCRVRLLPACLPANLLARPQDRFNRHDSTPTSQANHYRAAVAFNAIMSETRFGLNVRLRWRLSHEWVIGTNA
jgi:hypothetical protein